MSEHPAQPVKSSHPVPHPVLRILVPLVILAAGGAATVILIKTPLVPTRSPAAERAALVQVMMSKAGSAPVVIETAGTVVPQEAVSLQARVSGEIIAIHDRFVPGGRFAVGETILEIDPADYRLDASNTFAALVRAEAGLEIEKGLQDVARHEWGAMQALDPDARFSDGDRDLALRVPQLRLAESQVWSARAAHERALLNLERTRVRAPINAVVRERHVSVGAQVGSQTVLANLAGTDAYWVSVTLPAGHLKWIALPDPEGGRAGARTRVIVAAGAKEGAAWEGRVIQRLPDLEPRGRQAQLLVEIRAPGTPAEGDGELPIGAYVQALIDGPILNDVYVLPLAALRDGRWVWLMNGEDRLDIREVTPLWTDRERVLIREEVRDGERVVVSDISIPIQGMPLRIEANAGGKNRGAGAVDE